MSRAAHPRPVVQRAHALRAEGLSYRAIAGRLWTEFGVQVGEATVRDWVTYYTRGAAT